MMQQCRAGAFRSAEIDGTGVEYKEQESGQTSDGRVREQVGPQAIGTSVTPTLCQKFLLAKAFTSDKMCYVVECETCKKKTWKVGQAPPSNKREQTVLTSSCRGVAGMLTRSWRTCATRTGAFAVEEVLARVCGNSDRTGEHSRDLTSD